MHISSYSVAETKETHFCATNILKVKCYFKFTEKEHFSNRPFICLKTVTNISAFFMAVVSDLM